MSEGRAPLVVLAAVLLLGIGLLVWKLKGGAAESSDAPASSEQRSAAVDNRTSSSARPTPTLGDSDDPLDDDGTGELESDPALSDPRVAPGTRIVDNRGREPTGVAPTKEPEFVVAAPVIREMRRVLRGQMVQCQEAHKSEIGDDARVSGQLGVSIQSEVLTVVDLEVDHTGVPESGKLLECARQALAGLQMRAPGHDDVKRHVIRFPFNLPLP